jgi:hypothetical protein
MEKYPPYQSIFAKISYGESQMLDKAFYEEEVRRLCLSFEQQVQFLRFILDEGLHKLLLYMHYLIGIITDGQNVRDTILYVGYTSM